MIPRRILMTLVLASSACTGAIDEPEGTRPEVEDPGESDPTERLPPFEPAAPVLPRLTQAQYRAALVDLLGAPLPRAELPADTNPYLFFNIGAASTTLSERGAELYEDSAALVAQAVFRDAARRGALVGCDPASEACLEGFVARFGRHAFRRPLEPAEQARWVGVARTLAEGDPWRGLERAVAGMLQSPFFLYRVELGEPDPEDPTRRRYTGYEMASRLAFLFTNAPPDEALLDAAAAGELDDAAGVEAHARRLAEDPRAREAIQAFFAQYFDLGRLERVERDPARYPVWTDTMAASMRREVELLVDDIVFRRDADLRELFDTRQTFVNDELAALYGVDAPGASPIAYVPVELPADGPRAGVLTLGAFLAMNAHQTETSPTLRGKYVRERVLCQTVPAPPDDIDLNLEDPESAEARTLRERLEQHRRDPACASCHAFIDPPGMLFEQFDSVGRFRTEEPGGPVDASGELDGTPLAGAKDLALVLRDDPRVPACVVRQLFRHASGRLERTSEARALRALEEEFAAGG
ncbi:MAG TPA: DUF1592 domain-containing protein, partial [Polyangiaceae bacterium LLY-WYZ-15_(1-7)]|nr:DUF1592 domain-containing protein [Polyangiaceae bacterium LLY-WYZ-15_(1-7)]